MPPNMDSFGAVSFNSLFRRGCITSTCSKDTPPCPTDCREDQVCSLVPPTCNKCQQMVCAPAAAAQPAASSTPKAGSSASNVGAIAGGVAGGVAVIALITYLVWRFCIKTKRQQYEQENWAEEPEEPTASEKEFSMRRDARASTQTVGSVASSVLTRASNIIQIAYIPGVTNRSAPSTPGLLVPPVPPIPIALSATATTPRYEQEHFFMPGDLRDSTYSGYSDRTSYARNSVASTIYGKNAVVSPVPAQTVMRAKAAVVSVKSTGQGGELTPPVPSVDFGRYGNAPPSPAFSVGSTFLNNASAATQLKPQIIRVVSNAKRNASRASSEDAAQSRSLLARDSNAITIIDDTPTLEQGPFSNNLAVRRQSGIPLGTLVEESSTRRTADGKDGKKETTPFGDENEVKET